jgi:hypothetical protein
MRHEQMDSVFLTAYQILKNPILELLLKVGNLILLCQYLLPPTSIPEAVERMMILLQVL